VQSVSELDSAGDLTDVEQPRAPLTSEDTSISRALVATGATGTLASSGGSWGVSVGGGFDGKGRQGSAPESAGDMFARWENEEVDAESVVRDALRAGRVPLAVVQLHRIRSKAFLRGSQDHQPKMIDVFQDVQEIGRGIVYELLCKVSLVSLVVGGLLNALRLCCIVRNIVLHSKESVVPLYMNQMI
jgi:hypothetical protein